MQISWVLREDLYLSRANQKSPYKEVEWVLDQVNSQGLESSPRFHNRPTPLYPKQHQSQTLLTRIKVLTRNGNLQL